MEIILFVLIILFASILQGATGFGFAIIATPLTLLVLSTKNTITVFTLISIVLNGILIIRNKSKLDFKFIIPLIIFGILGLPFGFLILKVVNPELVKIIISIFSFIFALTSFLKIKVKYKFKITDYIISFITGVLQTSVGINGPPMVILLTSHKLKQTEIRKNLAVFFLTLSVVSMPGFLGLKLLNSINIFYFFVSLPFVLVGAIVGTNLAKYLSDEIFYKIVLSLVIFTSVYNIFTTFINL